MPNWISNSITFVGSDTEVALIRDYVKSEESDFDFNKIIPMPEDLHVKSSTIGELGMIYLFYKGQSRVPKDAKEDIEHFEQLNEDEKKEALDLGRKYLENIAKYGFPDWYGWRLEYWGDKWNALDVETDGNCFYFETPWAAPYKIYEHISKAFPNVKMEYHYYDHVNMSSGDGALQAGELLWSEYESGDLDLIELDKEEENYQGQESNDADVITASTPQADDDLPF